MPIDFNNPPTPYGHPLRMVDRILALDTAASEMTALKVVSRNEPLLQGHFPGFPILPGILQIETAAQACSLLFNVLQGHTKPVRMVIAESRVKHLRPVLPGDVMTVEIKLTAVKLPHCAFRVGITVGAEEVMKGSLVLESLEERRRRWQKEQA